jgi:hypothetical protein
VAWANGNQHAMRDAIGGIAGVLRVEAVDCGSKRCSVEVVCESRSAGGAVSSRLQGVSGFPRARIRKTKTEDGFVIRAVLARSGFTVWGEDEPARGDLL